MATDLPCLPNVSLANKAVENPNSEHPSDQPINYYSVAEHFASNDLLLQL